MKARVRISLLVGILLVSIFPILIRLELASGLISAFYRMFIAALVLVPYAIVTKQYKIRSMKMFLLTVLCGCIFASDISVWNISIQNSSATQATLLTNLSPVWVGVFSLVFLNRKPAFNFWVGMLVALLGLVLLIGVNVFLYLSFDLAFGLGILSGVFYALYFLVSKYVLSEVEVVPFMANSTLAASIYLAIINLVFGESFGGYAVLGWAVFAVQGVCCQLLAWLLLGYAMKNMRPTRVSLSMLSQAFVTAILAMLFLDEQITLQVIIGGVFILLGIAITFLEKPLFELGRER